jgi:hypothetical protein
MVFLIPVLKCRNEWNKSESSSDKIEIQALGIT